MGPSRGAAALYVAFWLLVHLRSLIVLLLISLFLAFALEPAANVLARRGWRRGLATATVFALVIVGVVAFVVALGSLLVDQLSALADAIPGYAQQIVDFVNKAVGTQLTGDQLATSLRDNDGVQAFVGGVAAAAVGLFTFYLVADGPRLRRTVCSVLPPQRQQVALRVWELAIESTSGYVGLWVGLVSQFVPTVGTYLAGALPGLIALLNQPLDAVWVLAFIVVYQQFENYGAVAPDHRPDDGPAPGGGLRGGDRRVQGRPHPQLPPVLARGRPAGGVRPTAGLGGGAPPGWR
jgi:predicted PurR-regulated permease PerM